MYNCLCCSFAYFLCSFVVGILLTDLAPKIGKRWVFSNLHLLCRFYIPLSHFPSNTRHEVELCDVLLTGNFSGTFHPLGPFLLVLVVNEKITILPPLA